MAKAGATGWDNFAKINYLEMAITTELRITLAANPFLPQEYEEWKNAALTVDTRMRAARMTTQQGRPNSTAPQGKPPADDPMDWTPVKSQRAKWVSPEEIKRRKEKKLCLRCGRSDHFIGDCDQKPAKPPISTTTVKPREEGQEEEDDKSGKE